MGDLYRVDERSREYAFRYADSPRRISLSLPLRPEPFSPAESRPFFDALLPEGAVREQIANQLRIASTDSFGLLAALGRDCAGALQIVESKRMSEPPDVRWLAESELDTLIEQLPRRPLGVDLGDGRQRLSLAGVQRKAVLARDTDGRFGEPLNGMPSTHILKPDLAGSDYPAIATNEFFCMTLATRCGLDAAGVELMEIARRPCLVVERFDRDRSRSPARRLHQEDLCQALGLTPDFKYQQREWREPSHESLSTLLAQFSPTPGADRLAAATAAGFNFIVGNADAHAKNISLLHLEDGVRPAPLYDIVCTAAYPDLTRELSLGIGEAFAPEEVTTVAWLDLAGDFGLAERRFVRRLGAFAESVRDRAVALREEALSEGWHDGIVDEIVGVIESRALQVSDSAAQLA